MAWHALLLLAVAVAGGYSPSPRPWMDSTKTVDQRTSELLSAMTLDEKVAQLGYAGCDPSSKYPLGVGGCGLGGLSTAQRNALQTAVVNSTRLGIPASFFAETTHSSGITGGTNFPMPCSQGASWNTSLVEAIAAANALELRSFGGDQGLSPILQVCTDPRFGRMEENFAEDPFLVSAYGRAAVTGLQGEDGLGGPGTYLSLNKVAAQAKHYAMYGAGGKDGYTPFGGGPNLRTVYEIYLRPWRDVVQHGVRGVMAAHNMIDWTPCHGNHDMLTQTLRNRFGLGDGYVGSDNTNVEGLATYFVGFAANTSEAAALAIAAGVDQDMPGGSYLALAQQVRQGTVPVEHVDRAVSNILRKKFASRIFDHPFPTPSMAGNIHSPAHLALARQAAHEGSVLLKNDGGLLPLHSPKKVAVVGPFGGCASKAQCAAQTAMLGGYSARLGSNRIVTVHEAFAERGIAATYTQGSDGGRGGPPMASIAEAVQAAREADVAVVVIGTMACSCCHRCGNGEVGDRMDLDPEGQQLALLEAVLEVQPKTVCVLIHGRPVTFGKNTSTTLDRLPALLAAWRPGEEGGRAVVDLLLGDVSPSGRLAQAWPRSVGYLSSPVNPWYQAHSSMTGGNYFGNGDGTPLSALFPFGHGLSYSTFTVSNLVLPSNTPSPANGTVLAKLTLPLTVTVKNSGNYKAAAVVMATFTKQTYRVVRYLRELAGFAKVTLAPGDEATVTINVRVADLARFSPTTTWGVFSGAYVVDGGQYKFEVGTCVSMEGVWDNSCSPLSGTVALGKDRELFGVYL